jgi:hypothetical protein
MNATRSEPGIISRSEPTFAKHPLFPALPASLNEPHFYANVLDKRAGLFPSPK